MLYRHTDRYRQALDFARQEALVWNHRYLGCEHLLMGLLKTSGSVAATVLNGLKIDETKARTALVTYVCAGKEGVAKRRLPRTPFAKKALRIYAKEESRSLNHRAIGTEHMLLGLLRNEKNVAVKVLVSLGLTPTQVRESVLTLVAPGD
ncbi:Clp protease N-terminal domain-containing protein [Planctomycetota bacterium]